MDATTATARSDRREGVAAPTDPVAVARSLRTLVEKSADQAEQDRRLPQHVAAAMAEAGLYRIAAPAHYDGTEHPPTVQIGTIEAVSEADGATGWNLMIGIETFGLMALTFEGGRELFADPRTIVSSSTAAIGTAERVEGGFLVNGQWQFVSGVHNSHFFGGLVRRAEHGELMDEGWPVYAVVPIAEAEILDTWQVGGMRGSGSHDVRISDVVVPDERMGVPHHGWIASLRAAAPVVRIPLSVRLAYNKVGVSLGIARAAIDEFMGLAHAKTPRFGTIPLRERPFAQRSLAQAEVRLRGARALVMELVEEIWTEVVADRPVSDQSRALFQAACSDAVAGCIEAVTTIADAAGTTANFLSSPLERQLRNVRVVGQHVTVAPHLIDDAGRMLLGLEPESFMLRQRGVR
jgi:alkylation response protein AidB-like acyl-CoA dehydrogenase